MRKYLFLLLMGLTLSITACEEEQATSSSETTGKKSRNLALDLPEIRQVRLGLQPFPHDFSPEALSQAYEKVYDHSDLMFYHLDSGIPWTEALAGQPYHANFLADIETMVDGRRSGQPLYVAITPNQPERDQIALYRGVEESMELPPEWQGKAFDDPDVITAYLNHARFMIDTLQPDYFAYGIEVTCNFKTPQDPALADFLVLAAEVYPTLKAEYPDLPIFLTICTGSFEHDEIDILFDVAKQVIEYSDYVAISTYPYWIVPGMNINEANPDQLPRDWFAQWANLAPDKPFAIAETAYIAETLDMTPVPGWHVNIPANETWQADYVSFMIAEANKLDAEFIAWFVPRDYDQLYELMAAHFEGAEIVKTWRDTGFWDGNGSPRPSLDVWDAWLNVPYEK